MAPSMKELPDSIEATETVVPVRQGWAMQPPKKHRVFSEDLRLYLLEKFDEGIVRRKKHDPKQIAAEMKKVMRSGHLRFQKYDYLTPNQILSYWSREAKYRRDNGVTATRSSSLRANVPETRELYDDYFAEEPLIEDPDDAVSILHEAIDNELSNQ